MARGNRWWSEPPPWAWAAAAVSVVAVVLFGFVLPSPGALSQAEIDRAAARASAASAAATPEQPVSVFLGDSYTAGTGASTAANRWTALVARAQGWQEVNRGQGGTGYANGGPGPDTAPYTGRVAEVVNLQPDVVVVAGGQNDLSPDLIGQATVAVAQVYRQLRAKLPDARIIAVGPSTPDAATGELVTKLDSAVHGVADEVGATYVSLLGPPVLGVGGFLAADGVHPNDAGHKAIADRVNAGIG